VSGVSYGPLGPTQVNIGSGTDKDSYSYDPNTGHMTQYQFNVGSANTKGVLTWNTNGSLGSLAITDGLNAGGTQTCTFGYDDLSRLTSDNCGSAWSQTFSFDQYNNLTKSGSSSWNPGYNTKNQYSGIGATYDLAGNMTYDSWNHYAWDDYGKLVTISSGTPSCGTSGACITYDALGQAVEKSVGSVYSEILYTQGGTVLMTNPTTVYNAHLALPGGGVLSVGGGNYYLHSDWLGTARVASNVAGGVTYDRAFAPYGEQYLPYGAGSPPVFTGDVTNLFTGLFDTPNRELNSGQGRWLSPDSSGSGWNAYAYGTDPNTQIDPSGLQIAGLIQGAGRIGIQFGGGWDPFSTGLFSTAERQDYHDSSLDEYDHAIATAKELFPERFDTSAWQYEGTSYAVDRFEQSLVGRGLRNFLGAIGTIQQMTMQVLCGDQGASTCSMALSLTPAAVLPTGLSFEGQGPVAMPAQLELPFMSQVDGMVDGAWHGQMNLGFAIEDGQDGVTTGGAGFNGPYLATSQSDGAAAIGNYLAGGSTGLVVNSPMPLPVQLEFPFDPTQTYLLGPYFPK
jgi:RHS repeat-associated protein